MTRRQHDDILNAIEWLDDCAEQLADKHRRLEMKAVVYEARRALGELKDEQDAAGKADDEAACREEHGNASTPATRAMHARLHSSRKTLARRVLGARQRGHKPVGVSDGGQMLGLRQRDDQEGGKS